MAGLGAGSMINWIADRWSGPAGCASTPAAARRAYTRPAMGLVLGQPGRSRQAAAIALTAALAFMWLCRAGGPLERQLAPALALCFLLLIAALDLKHHIVPKALLGPAALVALLLHAVPPGRQTLGALLGGATGLAPFLLVALLRPGQLGGGDIKLAALIGLFAGFPQVLWPVSVGIMAGGITSITIIAARRGALQTRIPYAPFLCLGAMISLLYNPLSALL